MKRSDKKPLGCGICPYKTNSACHLERHLRIHTGQKPYACTMCSYRATDGGLLKRHMRIHSGEKPFTCSICGHKTAQSCSLKDHMAVHTGKKRYACEMCPFQCSRIGRLRDHQLHHQVVTIKNEDSPGQSSQPDDENPAVVQETGCKCQHCGLEFQGMPNLNRHLATAHSKSEPSHATRNTPNPLYYCTLCPASAETLEILNAHFSRHIIYKCLECDSSFETPSELIAHGPDHSEELIFNCNKCDFKSKTRNELRGHERIHNNSQSQICKECGFVSKSGTEFAQHLQTHTSTEMVQCNICSTKFSKTSELREHMVVHYARSRARITRKPMKFAVEDNMGDNVGTFHCYYCSYKCSEEDQMAKHIEIIHIALPASEHHDSDKVSGDNTNQPDDQPREYEANSQTPDKVTSPSKTAEIDAHSKNIDRHSCPCTSYGLHCYRNLEYHYQHLSHFMNPNDAGGLLPLESGKCRFCNDHQHSDGHTGGQKELFNLTQFSFTRHINNSMHAQESRDQESVANSSHPAMDSVQESTDDDLLDNNKNPCGSSKSNLKRNMAFNNNTNMANCAADHQESDATDNIMKKIKKELVSPKKQETHEHEKVMGNVKNAKFKNELEKSKSAELLLAQLRKFFSESFPKIRSPSPTPNDRDQPAMTNPCTEDILTIELSSDSNASDQSY